VGTTVEREPALQLWTLLRDRAFASLKDDFTARVAECSLSLPQGKLVRELARPESQRELARRLHYDPSNITSLADSLEARGLIERRADAADRRFRLLAFTAAGGRLRAALGGGRGPPPALFPRFTRPARKKLLDPPPPPFPGGQPGG